MYEIGSLIIIGVVAQWIAWRLRVPAILPLILAGIYGLGILSTISNEIILSAFILVFNGLSAVVLYLLTTRIMNSTGGLISALLWITYPLNLWNTKQPNSEIPFILFFYLSVFLFWVYFSNKKSAILGYFVTGIIAGFSTLIRPSAFGLILIYILFLLVMGDYNLHTKLISSGSLAVGWLIVLVPWHLYAYLKSTELIFLSTGGFSSINDGLTFAVRTKGYRTSVILPQDVRNFMNFYFTSSRNGQIDSISDTVLVLIEAFIQSPFTLTKLGLIKAARSWFGTDSGRWEQYIIAVQIFYIALVTLGGLGLQKIGKIQRIYTAFITLIMAYFWLITISVLSIVRYMVPVTGLLFTFIPAISFLIRNNSIVPSRNA